MRKFDRTNMKYNNPAGDLLTELEAADLTSNKVDSLASSGVVCTISVECGSIFREIVIQRRYINESILFDFQQFLFNSLNNLCIRTLIYEMHICGQEGVLRGNESEQYQYYILYWIILFFSCSE